MGRGGGGLAGRRVQEDIESGNWRSVHYQVARELPPSANWFLVENFVDRLGSAGQLEDDPVDALVSALDRASMVLTRVVGEGSIAEQLRAGAPRLRAADPAEVRRAALLYRRAAETARYARSESAALYDLLQLDST